jgi:hypothetical protein
VRASTRELSIEYETTDPSVFDSMRELPKSIDVGSISSERPRASWPRDLHDRSPYNLQY